MKKSYAIITTAFLFLLLIWVDIVGVRTEDIAYSDREQRDLAAMPAYPVFYDPEQWAKEVDRYLMDQFPYRAEIIRQMHSVQAATGNNVVQDLYQIDSDYLFTVTYPTNEKRTNLMAEELKAASESYSVPVVYAIVPLKTVSLADSIEEISNETNLLNRDRTVAALEANGLDCIDICSYFLDDFRQDELQDFYFKSDFHWNPKGGYYAGVGMGEGLKELGYIENLPLTSDFQWIDFSLDRSYMGDLQRRISEKPYPGEYIPFYELRRQDGLHYYIDLDGEEVERNTIVACGLEEEIFEYNRVSTYNLGYLRIENENAVNKKGVLIFKDSYQNMTIDYLTDMFSEITVMDPRVLYCSFDEVMEHSHFDMILCIYHESNISEELIKFLAE